MNEHDRYFWFVMVVLLLCALIVAMICLATQAMERNVNAAVFDEVEKINPPYEEAYCVHEPPTPGFHDEIDTYLAYTGASYDHLVDGGRRLDMLKRGIPALFFPATQAYMDAAFIAYYDLCFKTFMAFYAPGTPVLARSMEIVKACYLAGIDWEMAAATLYAEADWGRQTTGLVWGNAYSVQGWIQWLQRNVPGDLNDPANVCAHFHGAENMEEYTFNFCNVVERGRAWRP